KRGRNERKNKKMPAQRSDRSKDVSVDPLAIVQMRFKLLSLFVIFLCLVVVPARRAGATNQHARYISYDESAPILNALREVLPSELRNAQAVDLPATWRNWAERQDRDIRARLAEGDEDSGINFLLFGTSFTKKPRITLSVIARLGEKLGQSTTTTPDAIGLLDSIKARVDDLIQSMTTAAS